MRIHRAVSTVMWVSAAATLVVSAAEPIALTPTALRNHPAIQYQQTPPQDPVARLGERLQRGDVQLRFDSENGYLRSILDELKVPDASQVLVFSKTSFQARRINPSNPRALYFNDTVSVGWVRGGEVVELVAQDPRQGAMFYTIEQDPSSRPAIKRDLSCIQCHTGDGTMNVPGMFLGSVFPSRDGSVLFSPVFSSDHRSPFEFRWGGWYVTGTHSLPRHLGNATVSPESPNSDMVNAATLHTTSLAGKFDMAGYLTPHSDIVALMMLEHQSRLLNVMARAGWEERIGLGDAERESLVRELVDYLLFVDETPLPGPVRGSSDFQKVFEREGPRDSRGRSLRELDLRTRMMRYPCSYLIYSAPFEAMPPKTKAAVYERMWAILSGAVQDVRYQRLSPVDRQAVLDILRETKPNLPGYFGASPGVSP